MINLSKIHYSWVVMIGCSCMLFCSIGMVFNTFSVFIDPLVEQIPITRAQASLLVSIMSGWGVVAMFASGYLYSNFSTRKILGICGLFIPLGFALFSVSTNYIMCVAAMSMIGFGYGTFAMIPVSILISRWFLDKRGIALGLASAGTGVATFFLPPILTNIIADYGLGLAFQVQGLLSLLMIIIAVIIIRDFPREKNCRPYVANIGTSVNILNETIGDDKVEIPAESFKKLILSRNFLLMSIAVFIHGVTLIATTSHLAPLLISKGYSPMFASMMVSIYGITLIGGKIFYGSMTDKIGTYLANYYILLIWMMALIFTFFVDGSVVSGVAFALLVGMGIPAGTLCIPLWAADFFSHSGYAKALSSLQAISLTGGAIGAVLPGIIYDATGAYQSIYSLFAVCTIITLVIVQYLYIKNGLSRPGL